jgi:hypothetical protein
VFLLKCQSITIPYFPTSFRNWGGGMPVTTPKQCGSRQVYGQLRWWCALWAWSVLGRPRRRVRGCSRPDPRRIAAEPGAKAGCAGPRMLQLYPCARRAAPRQHFGLLGMAGCHRPSFGLDPHHCCRWVGCFRDPGSIHSRHVLPWRARRTLSVDSRRRPPRMGTGWCCHHARSRTSGCLVLQPGVGNVLQLLCRRAVQIATCRRWVAPAFHRRAERYGNRCHRRWRADFGQDSGCEQSEPRVCVACIFVRPSAVRQPHNLSIAIVARCNEP